MPPPPAPLRAFAFRPRPRGALFRYRPSLVIRNASETNSPEKLPQAAPGQPGPNTQQQEHVSEEAAKMAKIEGKEGPDLDQGTPVQEIIKEEPEQRERAPEVVKQDAGKPTPPPATSPQGTRQFSTHARRRLPELQSMPASEPSLDPSMLLASKNNNFTYTNPTGQVSKVITMDGVQTGHKFPLPPLSSIPVKTNSKQKSREHAYNTETTPIVTQLTNLLMRDGKKSVAERNMANILSALRTLPAPTLSTTRPLIPGTPAASHLPLNPIAYLTAAVDSVAPLMRIRSQRGAAGGGVALQIPVPLGLRQRRRTAFTWILDAASKRANRGSGKDMFAQRVAQELVAVVEGRSGVWEKRQAVHRLATAARTNVGWSRPGMRR